MRIPFLLLLANALLVTQIASAAASEETKLRGALLKAMKTHDTVMVKAVANSGHSSIDNDEILQQKIAEYLTHEKEYEEAARERAKKAALARKKAKKEAAERAAAKKAQIVQQPASHTDKAAQTAAEAAKKEEARKNSAKQEQQRLTREKEQQQARIDAKAKAKKEAAAKEAKRVAAQKAKEEKLAQKEAVRLATQEEKKAKKRHEQELAAKKERERKAKAAEKKRIAAKKAHPSKPLTVSSKKLLGTWKEVNSDKVITLKIDKDGSFTLEQVEDDGTLNLMGTWKSEENIFMMGIKQVQRNVHTRETDIHRVYKVVELTKHSLVLNDKRNRLAYALKR